MISMFAQQGLSDFDRANTLISFSGRADSGVCLLYILAISSGSYGNCRMAKNRCQSRRSFSIEAAFPGASPCKL